MMSGSAKGRSFAWKTRRMASGSSAWHPSPYTVSVGKDTRWPERRRCPAEIRDSFEAEISFAFTIGFDVLLEVLQLILVLILALVFMLPLDDVTLMLPLPLSLSLLLVSCETVILLLMLILLLLMLNNLLDNVR